MNLSELMDLGHELLGRGDFKSAIRLFTAAKDMKCGADARCEAMHMLGIAYRLDGEQVEAETVLAEAQPLAGDNRALAARIERDLGMAVLDRAVLTDDTALFIKATTHFMMSCRELLACGELIEVAASEGFLGRVYFEQGQKSAVGVLLHVHYQLTGRHSVYELNNLMWVARASFVHRWRFARRAFGLMAETGHTRRRKEYLILLVGGDRLYRRMIK